MPSSEPPGDEVLARYLLGSLTPSETRQVDDCLTHPGVLDRLAHLAERVPRDPLTAALRDVAAAEPTPPDQTRRILDSVARALHGHENTSIQPDTASGILPLAVGGPLPPRIGPYRILRELGRGGMGVVLEGYDEGLDRSVAVKILSPAFPAPPEARARFLREARAAAAVRHDHVVSIYHVGEHDGAPFLVMPLLEGESLADRLRRGPLSPAEVVRVGREAALGLAAAHAANVVHRDVKPANLWLEAPPPTAPDQPVGHVRILDFGLARLVGAGESLTQAGALLGTAAYMAPEQAEGKVADARTDLFSLGAVLYQCATGRNPFAGESLLATLRAVSDRNPPPPHALNPALPTALSDLIVRLLAKSPADRPTSARAVAEALAGLALSDAPKQPADDRLVDLLIAWEDAVVAGARPTPESICRDCPELLSEFRLAVAGVADVDEALVGFDPGLPDQVGAYVIRGELGRGGMGVVYRAEDPHLNRAVAVKVVGRWLVADPVAKARFLREARAAAAVRHDHVVSIYHVGEHDGAPFLVMPLLEGESLADRLRRGPLSPAEVVRVGREAALGLAAAHAANVVHRDVKPANLWLESKAGGQESRVTILDFGLARSTDPTATGGVTGPGLVLGTAAYMSPEQAEGKTVDARTDLFSLGTVLYQCITGKSPFAGESVTATLRAVTDLDPPPPHALNPAIPAALSELIMHLLAKNPANRPTSARVVAEALARLGPSVDGPPTWRARALGLLAGVALVIGVGVWAATRSTTGPEVAGGPSPTAPPLPTPVPPSGGGVVHPASVAKYRGSVDILVQRTDDDGSDKLFPLWDPRSMPLRPGDDIRIQAEIEPAAFVYLFWIDEAGQTVPVHPWDLGKWGTRPTDEKPVDRVNARFRSGKWPRISGTTAGTETIVMLARATPLSLPESEIRGWFADLTPLAFRGEKARAWFEDFDLVRTDPARRSLGEGDAAVGTPLALQEVLHRRIGSHATFERAISFSRLGKKDGE